MKIIKLKSSKNLPEAMKCLKCNSPGKITFPNGNLCSKCFLEVLVNRIKSSTRRNPLRKNDRVLVQGKLAYYFLKKAVGNLPLRITVKKDVKNNSGYDKIVIPSTADDFAYHFYSELMKKNPDFEENRKIIRIFKTILDEELEKASKILKIKFKPAVKDEEFMKIKKRYPELIFGMVKTADEIRKI